MKVREKNARSEVGNGGIKRKKSRGPTISYKRVREECQKERRNRMWKCLTQEGDSANWVRREDEEMSKKTRGQEVGRKE